MNPSEAMEFERHCSDLFTKMGWKSSSINPDLFQKWLSSKGFKSQPGVYPDIALSIGEEFRGFVDLFIGAPSPQIIRKRLKVAEFMKSLTQNAIFYVITNGYVFDLYLKGKYYGQLSTPPSPKLIEALVAKEATS